MQSAVLFVCALVVARIAAVLARRAGWTRAERAAGLDARSRARRSAVAGPALVGGLALASVFHAACWFDPLLLGPRGAGGALEQWLSSRGLASIELAGGLALGGALLVGWIDDLRELGPGSKLLGQALCGLALAWPALAQAPGSIEAWQLAGFCALGACVACNLANTYDNADGALVSLAGLAMSPRSLALSATILGLLPLQTLPHVARTPLLRRAFVRVFLGDAGAHWIGMWIFLTPQAWPALLLPACDLARVCALRVARGRPFWQGDQSHLSHALLEANAGPLGTLACLCVAAAPGLALSLSDPNPSAARWLSALAATLATMALLLIVARRAASRRG